MQKEDIPKALHLREEEKTGSSMRLEIPLPRPLHIPTSRTWLGLCAKCINISTLGFHHGVALGWQNIEKQKSPHFDNSHEKRWWQNRSKTIHKKNRRRAEIPRQHAWCGEKYRTGQEARWETQVWLPTSLCTIAWRGPGQEEDSVKIIWHQVEMLPSSDLS